MVEKIFAFYLSSEPRPDRYPVQLEDGTTVFVRGEWCQGTDIVEALHRATPAYDETLLNTKYVPVRVPVLYRGNRKNHA